MQLLLVRHAIAEERQVFAATGQSDELRPLTDIGSKKMHKAALGLRYLVPELAQIVSSPLTRAQQTAAILAAQYPNAEQITLEALAPDASPQAVPDWLAEQNAEVLALVGHEPDLGMLACYLLTGQVFDFIPLKKAGACLLEFGDTVAPGQAELRWLLTPRQLRELRRAK